MLVGEEAFARIAPAISGIADRSTVHNLFRALAGDQQGISLGTWVTYVDELLNVEFMEHGNHMGLVNPLGFQMRKSYASALARSGLLSSGRITWHGLGKLY